jgi:hypothetical protein
MTTDPRKREVAGPVNVTPAAAKAVTLSVKTVEVLGKMISVDAKTAIDDEENCDSSECPVCMEKLYSRDFTGSLKGCSHVFCFSCIHKWSQTENTCPMCKKDFKTISKSIGKKQLAVDIAVATELKKGLTTTTSSNSSSSKKRKSSSVNPKPVNVKVQKRTQAQSLESEAVNRMFGGGGNDLGVLFNSMIRGASAVNMLGGDAAGTGGGPNLMALMALASLMPPGSLPGGMPFPEAGLPGMPFPPPSLFLDMMAGVGGRGGAGNSSPVRGNGTSSDPIELDSDTEADVSTPAAAAAAGSSSSRSSSSSGRGAARAAGAASVVDINAMMMNIFGGGPPPGLMNLLAGGGPPPGLFRGGGGPGCNCPDCVQSRFMQDDDDDDDDEYYYPESD